MKQFRNYRNNLLSSEINKLIGSVSNIVLDKDNAVNLMTKNELDYMESAYQAMDIPSKDESSLELSDAVDVIASNKVFGINTDAKRMLGIAAKYNTLYALFMEVGMKTEKEVLSFYPQNTVNGTTSLSSLYTQPYSGSSSNYTNNTEALYIPKLLSEMISASVDVANDNRIGDPKMNFNKLTMPVYLWGISKGTHLFDLMDVIADPRVIEYTTEYRKRDSIAYQHYIKTTIANEKAQAQILSKRRFVRETLASLIPKNLIVKDPMNGIMLIDETLEKVYANKNKVNKDNYKLIEYISMAESANKATELSAATSWDTTPSNSFVEFAYTDKQFKKISKDAYFNTEAVAKLRNSSVIAGLNVTDFVSDKFGKLFSIISSDKFISKALELYNMTSGVDLKDFSRDFTNDFLTFLYQNNQELEGQKAYPLMMPMLLKDNPNNIEKIFMDTIASVKNPAILSNSFVNNLKFNKFRDSQYLEPVLKNPNLSTPEINALNNDLLKLLSSTYATNPELNDRISKVTKDLIMSTLLKNGLNKTFGSFISIIPTEIYTDVLRDVVANGITENMYKEFSDKFMSVRKGKYFPRLDIKTPVYDRNNRFNYFISPKNVVSLQDMVNESDQMDDFADRVLSGEINYKESNPFTGDITLNEGVGFTQETVNVSQGPSAEDLGLDNLNLSQDDFKCQ